MHSPSRDLCSDQPCSSKSLLHSNADFREASDRERSERRKKRKYAHSPTDTNYERTKRNKHGREAQSEPHSTKSSSTHSTEGSSHHKKSLGERLWVAPHLRVRIVDTKFKGGKYYNSKVRQLFGGSLECAWFYTNRLKFSTWSVEISVSVRLLKAYIWKVECMGVSLIVIQ